MLNQLVIEISGWILIAVVVIAIISLYAWAFFKQDEIHDNTNEKEFDESLRQNEDGSKN
jgi:magnesium-transporting ATPase (P-type)